MSAHRELRIGTTVVHYTIRRSGRATRHHMKVTPEGVMVVAPNSADEQSTIAFVESKKRWLFNARNEVAARHARVLAQQWASGAKVQFRGRWLMLDVSDADVPTAEVAYRSKFQVVVPSRLTETARLEAVRAAVTDWLRHRAERDLHRFGRQHARTLALEPSGFRLSDAKTTWGTCGKDGTIRVHWRLVQAPLGAFEYVVAHELVHRVHRNHGGAFWRTLATALPDWAEKKALLERWETEHRAV